MNLGLKESDYYNYGGPVSICDNKKDGKEKKKERIVYPEFRLNPAQCALVKDVEDLKAGDIVTATVKLKVSRTEASEKEDKKLQREMSFDIHEIEDIDLVKSKKEKSFFDRNLMP